MNIDINLLPEELRPRPAVEKRTLFLILLILALAGGCYLLFDAKSNAEAEMADLEKSIDQVNQQINDIRQQGQALKSSVDRLDTLTKSYESFVASRILWGNALERVQSLKPTGVEIGELTQQGNTLLIGGTSSGYSTIAGYGRSLDRDTKFILFGWPKLNSATFSLTVSVAPGGGG
jgi:Tfp pilus assembly protein PilN